MAEEIGHPLDPDQVELLDRYRHWLATEAVTAGGIGPAEIDRLDDRHIADSILYAAFFSPPERAWDLGSGVGLPGIPLAVLLPDTDFVLIDRSGRRVDLLKRAVRVLGLENATVRQEDMSRLRGEVPVIVSRASLPPDELAPIARRLLAPGGIAVVGGSWVAPPEHDGWETRVVQSRSLDRTVWVLIMRRQ
ncbi:MAG: class I SAM-dependent methyltransferase [Actinomycetes bacterium]